MALNGQVALLGHDGSISLEQNIGKVVEIEESEKYGAIALQADGKVITLDDQQKVLFDIGEDFSDSFYVSRLASRGSEIAACWDDKNNCINLSVWDGTSKIHQRICK